MTTHEPHDAAAAANACDSPATRLEWLIDAYFDGEIEPAERQELRRELLSTPAARELFWQMARLKVALHFWAGEAWGEAAAADEAGRGVDLCPLPPPGWAAWARRISGPFAAAIAACMACAGLGAGVALAFSPPLSSPMRRPLPVANGGFEEPLARPSSVPASRLPTSFGSWLGDLVTQVTERQGVRPFEGERMLVFEKALDDAVPGGGDQSRACDLYQWIDLRPFKTQTDDGRGVIECTVRFRNAAVPTEGQPEATRFTCRVRLFDSRPEEIAAQWPRSTERELASGGELVRIPAEGRAGDWHEVTIRALVPPAATTALIQVAASPDDDPIPGKPDPVVHRYPLAFCDDVRVELLTFPEQLPPLTAKR